MQFSQLSRVFPKKSENQEKIMMKLCPTCHCDLSEVERMGVLVDICFKCEGIWLERGELEQVSEHIRATQTASGDERDSAPHFVAVYETALRVRRGTVAPTVNHKFKIRNLLDVFR
jgi:Zn-finger nucleic acid-binding protein